MRRAFQRERKSGKNHSVQFDDRFQIPNDDGSEVKCYDKSVWANAYEWSSLEVEHSAFQVNNTNLSREWQPLPFPRCTQRSPWDQPSFHTQIRPFDTNPPKTKKFLKEILDKKKLKRIS